MAKSRIARVGARRPCSEWGRDIDSIDGDDDVDGIMKAVPAGDRLFFIRLLALYPALYGQFRVAIQPGKWSQPGYGTA